MKKAMIKVGFHILCFFMYHYGINMIWYIEAGEDVVKINYTTRHYWEAETISIILRAMTIAVYFFLFEQKIFLLYFYHIKYLKNMNWVFVAFWFSTLAWTPNMWRCVSSSVYRRQLFVCRKRTHSSLACQRVKNML